MKERRRALLSFVLLLTALALAPARAQTTAHAPAAAVDPLQMLPASDVVIVIDHGRIWHEAIPRIFGQDFAPLSKLAAEAEKFKAKTGIDVRSISRVAVGVRFLNPETVRPGIDKKDFGLVIIGQGDFEATKILEAMRREVKDKLVEETYKGQLIYTVDERPKGSTQPKPETETPAVAALDANTVALGDLAQMHATIDARDGGNRLSPDLLALVTRNTNALATIAANVPPGLLASFMPKEKTGNEEMDRNFAKFFEAVVAIRQMYLSAGLSANGVEASLGARFGDAAHPQSIADLLLGVRQQYGVFIDDKTIRELVEQIQITAQGDELQLRAELPQTVITAMLNRPKKDATATLAAPAAKSATGTTTTTHPRKKTRRTTRRKRS